MSGAARVRWRPVVEVLVLVSVLLFVVAVDAGARMPAGTPTQPSQVAPMATLDSPACPTPAAAWACLDGGHLSAGPAIAPIAVGLPVAGKRVVTGPRGRAVGVDMAPGAVARPAIPPCHGVRPDASGDLFAGLSRRRDRGQSPSPARLTCCPPSCRRCPATSRGVLCLEIQSRPSHRPSRAQPLRVALAAAVLATSVWLVVDRPVRLGLDLRGGTQIVLETHDSPSVKADADATDRTLEVLRRRVDALGVAEPIPDPVRQQPDHRRAARASRTREEAKRVIGRTAQLTFHPVRRRQPARAGRPAPRRGWSCPTKPGSRSCSDRRR